MYNNNTINICSSGNFFDSSYAFLLKKTRHMCNFDLKLEGKRCKSGFCRKSSERCSRPAEKI